MPLSIGGVVLLLGAAYGSPAGGALDGLLAGSGVTAGEFFAEYFQRSPLHISGEARVLRDDGDDDSEIDAAIHWRSGLLTSAQVYAALAEPRAAAACRAAELVISDRTVGKGGAGATEEDTAAAAESAECAFAGLDADTLRSSKATLLLPRVDDLFKSLHNVSCAVQTQLGGVHIGVNAYISPPPPPPPKAPVEAAADGGDGARRGFLMHRDGHDLIVIQTEGSKVWEFCEPRDVFSRLVAKGQHYGEDFVPDAAEYACAEVQLVKGDVLYLPRGTLHAPRIDAGSEHGSLHLSMGIDVRHFRFVDVLLAHTKSEALVRAMAATTDVGENSSRGGGGSKINSLSGCHELPTTRCVAFAIEAENGQEDGKEEWTWARLLAEMCEALPDRKQSELGYLSRNAFPMHAMSQVPAPAHAVEEYLAFVSALQGECGDVLGDRVRALLQARGMSVEEASGVEATVRRNCPNIIRSTFTRASFEAVIAETMHRAGQRVMRRRCDLPPWHEWVL